MSLVQELKRRNVFRVAIAYCGSGWLVLQLASMLVPTLNLPDWTVTALLFFGVLCFPFVLLFSWVYEFTPAGLRRTEHVQLGESGVEETRATLNKVITAFLLLVLALVLAEQFFPLLDHESTRPSSQSSLQAE